MSNFVIGILGLVLVIAGHYSFDNLATMIKSGFSSTGPTAALFVFSVLYFGVMSDAGMFDVIIGKLMKTVGDSVVGVPWSLPSSLWWGTWTAAAPLPSAS